MLVYLDNCCLNRPYDNQEPIKVQLETHAKLFIQVLIESGQVDLCWSSMLDLENNENPYELKKLAISKWKKTAKVICPFSDLVLKIGKELESKGIAAKDALHLASALASKSDYFITTNPHLLKLRLDDIEILNPVNFILEMEGAT